MNYERADSRLTNRSICTTLATKRQELAQRALDIPSIDVREIITGQGDLRIRAIGSNTDDITRISQGITGLGIRIDNEDLIYREYFKRMRSSSHTRRSHIACDGCCRPCWCRRCSRNRCQEERPNRRENSQRGELEKFAFAWRTCRPDTPRRGINHPEWKHGNSGRRLRDGSLSMDH